jgi:hypothetical protein
LPIAPYIKKGILVSFVLHVYLLLGNLVAEISSNRGELAGVYFLYIAIVFLISTAALTRVAVAQVSGGEKKNIFKPLIYFQFIVTALYFSSSYILSGRYALGAASAFFMALGALSIFIRFSDLRYLIKRTYSSDLRMIVFIFLLAFAARALFGINLVSKTTHGPNGYDGYLYASDDGDTYDATANRILKDPSILKKGEVGIWGNWDRFYGIFLAGFYKLFGRNFYLLVCAQALFGALIPSCIFLIGKTLFSRPAGLIASVFLSLKGGIILLSAYMGHEAVWLPLLYLIILALTYYFKECGRLSIWVDITTGVALGVVTIFRSMYLYFLPFTVIWEIFFFRNIKISRRLIHAGVVTLCSMALVLCAFGILHNKPSLINRQKAQYLWGVSRLTPPFQHLGNERFMAIGINFFADPKGSLDVIVHHPVKFAILTAKVCPLRVVAYFETFQFGYFDPIYMINPAKMANKFASMLEFYFTLFFLVGMIKCLCEKRILSSPIFLLLAFHIIFYAFILAQPSPRLKETSAPIIYLIGSVGACTAFKYLKRPLV